jgi:hypothetical protein
MALVLKDRVKETTISTGTGAIDLSGASAGFDGFSVIGDGNTTYYAIVTQDPGEWEVGVGTYTASGSTLSRDSVIASSNGGALVNFSAGVKDVFVTYPAENAVVAGNTSSATTGQALVYDAATGVPVWGDVQPVGTLQYFAGATTTTYPGSSWLPCLGGIVDQATYPELFSRIGLVINGGKTWTARTSGTAQFIFALTYGNNLYVYAASGGAVATSTDAITWTARTSGTGNSISALTYGNNLYVYAGEDGVLATSTDAITWTARTSGTASSIFALTFGNGLYVYAGAGGVLRTSTNAITWTARTSGTTNFINGLVYGNGLYVYAGAGGVLRTSTNAIAWTARTSGTTNNIRRIAYGNGIYVYAGDGGVVGTSADGQLWTPRVSGTTADNLYVYFVAGQFYAVGSNGTMITSTDGDTWVAVASGTAQTIYSLIFGSDRFVYVGGSGALATSEAYTYNTASDFALPSSSVNPARDVQNTLFIKATP